MDSGLALRIIIFATGIILFGISLSSLAHRKMTEPLCLTWGGIALIIVIAGIVLRPDEWSSFISTTGLVLIVLIGFCVVFGVYVVTSKVSDLMRRNLELAMQVSLLNQENGKLKLSVEELRERIDKLG